MSGWIPVAALVAAPATAQQHDSREINAVRRAWDLDATASSQDTAEAVDLLARSTPNREEHEMFAEMTQGTC